MDARTGTAASLLRPPTPEERERAAAHLLRAEREAARSGRVPAGASASEVESCGVVGFGAMGRGIALAFAGAGIPVTVFEEADDAWSRGEAAVAASLSRAVGRGRLDAPEAERRRGRIRRASRFGELGAADFVVEAVFEDLALKEEVFARLGPTAKPGAVLATNTSSLDVDRIARASRRPEAVLGTHFFNPAHAMRLLEVVVAEKTAPTALATAMALGVRLGKAPVPVGVCDGFCGNRMLYAYRRQADRLLLEGATPRQVDAALRDFGFRMGPFEVADLAGLDIGHAVRQRQAREALDRKQRPPPPTVADRLAESGRLGQKTGRGFYRYEPGDRAPREDPEVEELARRESAAQGIRRREVGAGEILERCLFALADEGLRILGEGVVERPGDVDVVWTLGYGFPPERGGPLYWAERAVGFARIAAALARYAREVPDPALEPSETLGNPWIGSPRTK